jgi:hypothetical protein
MRQTFVAQNGIVRLVFRTGTVGAGPLERRPNLKIHRGRFDDIIERAT